MASFDPQGLLDQYDIETLLMKEVRKRLKNITIESAYGPTISLDDPLKPGPPNPFLQRLQPRITVDIKGTDPLVIEPYGQPPETKWPLIKTVSVSVASFLLVTALKKALKR